MMKNLIVLHHLTEEDVWVVLSMSSIPHKGWKSHNLLWKFSTLAGN